MSDNDNRNDISELVEVREGGTVSNSNFSNVEVAEILTGRSTEERPNDSEPKPTAPSHNDWNKLLN